MTDADDVLIGRILTRREVLALFGTAGTAVVLAGCAPDGSAAASAGASALSPGVTSGAAATAGSSGGAVAVPLCVVKPEVTEGPYYVDPVVDRSDITTDSATGTAQTGLPLTITFAVSRMDGSDCTAYEGVLVDVWHCNADGVYSGVSDPGFDTSGEDWLRGYQVTDADGRATIRTIFPGWYSGRATHIHFKIRSDPNTSSGLEFTSQLFFDDELIDQVEQHGPYATNGTRDVRNDEDGIYGQTGGETIVAVTGDAATALEGTFEIGVQAS